MWSQPHTGEKTACVPLHVVGRAAQTPIAASQAVHVAADSTREGLSRLWPTARTPLGGDALFKLDEQLAGATWFRPREVLIWARDAWEDQQTNLTRIGGDAWLKTWPNDSHGGKGRGETDRGGAFKLEDAIDAAVERKTEELSRASVEDININGHGGFVAIGNDPALGDSLCEVGIQFADDFIEWSVNFSQKPFPDACNIAKELARESIANSK